MVQKLPSNMNINISPIFFHLGIARLTKTKSAKPVVIQMLLNDFGSLL